MAGAGEDLEVGDGVEGGGGAVVLGEVDDQAVEAGLQVVVEDLRPRRRRVAAGTADPLGEDAVGPGVLGEVEGLAFQAAVADRAVDRFLQFGRVDAVGDAVEAEADAALAELRLEAGSGDDEFVFITSAFTDTSTQVPVTAPVEQGFVSIDAGTGHSRVIVEASDPATVAVAPVLQDVLWWTVSGLGLALDLYGFAEYPSIALPQPAAQPYGLPGESDVRMLLRLAAGDITPPYVFLGRGGDGLVVITETGGWTNVSPDGPLTDSYTVRLSRPAVATVYITFTTAYGAGTPFAEFSLDGGLTWLLRAVLAIVPGDDFGFAAPKRHVRFSYATKYERIEQAVDRLARLIRR